VLLSDLVYTHFISFLHRNLAPYLNRIGKFKLEAMENELLRKICGSK